MKHFSLRLGVAVVVVSTIFIAAGPYYVRPFLKPFVHQIERLHPEYEIHGLGLTPKQLWVDTTIHRNIMAASGEVLRMKRLHASLAVGYISIAPVITFSLLLSLPGMTLKKRLLAILLAMPPLAAVALLDAPFRLIYQLEWLFYETSPPGLVRNFWQGFLMNGGPQFLALLVVLLAAAPFYLVSSPSNINISRNALCLCGSGKKVKRCCAA